MANIRSLITKSTAVAALLLTTSFLAACNNSSETSPAKTEASDSTKTPDVGADAKTMKAEDKAKTAESSETMKAEDAAKSLDALKKSLSGATSADMQKKSEELWTAKEYVNAVAVAEMAYKADGNKNAAYRLGTAYFGGTGVEKNLAKAAEYLNITALDDISYALYYRGLILSDKSYSGFDAKKARTVLEKAKQLGVAEAEDALKALPAG